MLILENKLRECCNPAEDFKPFKGRQPLDDTKNPLKFCRHCGQLWRWIRCPGEMDRGWEKVEIKKSL